MIDGLPPSMPDHVRAALAEAKARLVDIYGDRLARIVLYGSHARGDAGPESDVDVLVVLNGGYKPSEELKTHLVPLAVHLLDRFGADVSLQPYSADEIADVRQPLMWNIQSEGVSV